MISENLGWFTKEKLKEEPLSLKKVYGNHCALSIMIILADLFAR